MIFEACSWHKSSKLVWPLLLLCICARAGEGQKLQIWKFLAFLVKKYVGRRIFQCNWEQNGCLCNHKQRASTNYVPTIKIEYYDDEHPSISIEYYDEEHDRRVRSKTGNGYINIYILSRHSFFIPNSHHDISSSSASASASTNYVPSIKIEYHDDEHLSIEYHDDESDR